MAFNIETFRAKTNKGFLRSSNFLVYIMPPKWALNTDDGFTRDLAYLTFAATLPGVQILTNDSKIYGAGPTVKVPYDIGVTDMTMQFYVDAEGSSINYFHEWLRNIVNLSHDQSEVRSGAFSNQISYRDWYATTIDIMLFDDTAGDSFSPQDDCLSIYSLYDAYPTSISEASLDWQNGNNVMTFSVNFTFRSFERMMVNLPAAFSVKSDQSIPIPPILSHEPPQSSSKQSSKGFVNPKLQAINNFAKGIRDKSAQVRTKAVGVVQNFRQAIFKNELVQSGINILNTANDVKKTLGTLKQLNTSLKQNLIQDLKGAVKGGIRGL